MPPADREGETDMNKVFLTGRLTRDPEMRSLASGKNVTTVNVSVTATADGSRGDLTRYSGHGKCRSR